MAAGIAAPTSTTARRFGSASNAECRIDSISQSWAVLSGASPIPRVRAPRCRRSTAPPGAALGRRPGPTARSALRSTSSLDPGYIRGYVPGVRENGGQYTHAAMWAAMAFAALGDAERAWELMTP
jgi:cyclic beta-1,2-glucan synthetase